MPLFFLTNTIGRTIFLKFNWIKCGVCKWGCKLWEEDWKAGLRWKRSILSLSTVFISSKGTSCLPVVLSYIADTAVYFSGHICSPHSFTWWTKCILLSRLSLLWMKYIIIFYINLIWYCEHAGQYLSMCYFVLSTTFQELSPQNGMCILW